MKKLILIVVLFLMLFVTVVPTVALAQDEGTPIEFPATPEAWWAVLGAILVGLGAGVASSLIQYGAQKIIPILGEGETNRIVSALNILIALVLPVGVSWGILSINGTPGGVWENWDFVSSLMVAGALVSSQITYESRQRRA